MHMGAELGPESGSVAVRRVFRKADLWSAKRDGSIPGLSLIQLIQQVCLPAGGVRRRCFHGGGQHRRVSTKLYSRRSLCAGRVGGGVAVTQVMSVSPLPRFRPEHVAARPGWRPRPSHKVKGFGAFGSTATTGSWREHDVWIGEPGDLRTVFFETSEATWCRKTKTDENQWEEVQYYISRAEFIGLDQYFVWLLGGQYCWFAKYLVSTNKARH